ncbi:MAG: hypothetical protein IV086_18035 [Hyphomonadaceae bacterium]|nr:hypothetical protein [Hyphomonadaceae bacterium]
MLPPHAYEQARVNATEHAQVEVLHVARPAPDVDNDGGAFGACRVDARVVRVFRGRLRVGEAVSFEVSCSTPDARLPVGGTIWTRVDALDGARVLEGFFNRADAWLEVARDQIYIVPRVRAAPYCGPPTGECAIPAPRPTPPSNPLAALWNRLFESR